MDTVFEILHIVGAVFIVGPMAILPMSGMRAIRSKDAGAVRSLAKSTNIFTLISVVVALIGFALVGLADPKYDLSVTTGWVLASIIVYAAALGLSLFLVVPALRDAADSISASGDSAAASGYSRVAAGSGAVALLLFVVVVLMVWKP